MSGKLILKHSGATLILQYKDDRLISKALDIDNSVILNLVYKKDEEEIMRYFYSRGSTATLKEMLIKEKLILIIVSLYYLLIHL